MSSICLVSRVQYLYWKFNCQTTSLTITSSSAYTCYYILCGIFHNSTYIVAGVFVFNSYMHEEYRLLLFSDLSCRIIIIFWMFCMSFFLFAFLFLFSWLFSYFFVFFWVNFMVMNMLSYVNQSVIIWAECDVFLFQ